MSFQVVLVGQRWFIYRCYLAPDDAVTIECVVTAIGQRPCREELMVD